MIKAREYLYQLVDQLTDDVRWISHFDPIVPWGGDYSGKQNVPRFFQAINDNAETNSKSRAPICFSRLALASVRVRRRASA